MRTASLSSSLHRGTNVGNDVRAWLSEAALGPGKNADNGMHAWLSEGGCGRAMWSGSKQVEQSGDLGRARV